jgi:hypothetical protein
MKKTTTSHCPPFAFAAAMPPRAEALFPTDGWLKAVAKAGCTHLCLQNDPFFHPEMDLRDTGENTFRLLALYDMTAGPRAASYLAWLGEVDARAAAHGLRCAMELWEPRLTRLARRVLPSEWKGPQRAGGWVEPLCVGHPEARRWVMDQFRALAGAMEHLDALVLGINDNNAVLCGEECPRCGGQPVPDRLGDLYADIEKACRDVRPDLRVVAYDWMWSPAYYEAVFSRLSRGSAVLTRMERGVDHTPDPEHPEWHGRVYDESVGCDGLGPDFRLAQEMMARYGGKLIVMPTLSGMFESFQVPWVPAMGRLAGKFERMLAGGVDGWVDYDCGGIHCGPVLDLVGIVNAHPGMDAAGWLGELATRRYGMEAAPHALALWECFDRAVGLWPGQIKVGKELDLSGQFGIAFGLLPLHPFLPERVGDGEQARVRHFHFDPHGFAQPEVIGPVRALMAKVLDCVAGVPGLCDRIAADTPPGNAAAAHDRAIIEMVLLNWRSTANFFAWAAALLGDDSVDLDAVLRDEIETTRLFRALADRPELGYGNMTWHPERCVAMSVPQASSDLWRAIEVNKAAQWTQQPHAGLCGNPWAWKIAGLEKQLSRPPVPESP